MVRHRGGTIPLRDGIKKSCCSAAIGSRFVVNEGGVIVSVYSDDSDHIIRWKEGNASGQFQPLSAGINRECVAGVNQDRWPASRGNMQCK